MNFLMVLFRDFMILLMLRLSVINLYSPSHQYDSQGNGCVKSQILKVTPQSKFYPQGEHKMCLHFWEFKPPLFLIRDTNKNGPCCYKTGTGFSLAEKHESAKFC